MATADRPDSMSRDGIRLQIPSPSARPVEAPTENGNTGSSQDSVTFDDPKQTEPLRRTTTSGFQLGSFYLRTDDNDDEQGWWFASTAIPLLAATVGPLANVCSVAALVTSWRMSLIDPETGHVLAQLDGIPYADPRWCYNLNVISLVFGFVGNFFLLLNFTNRIRYIIALPVTIVLWYIATAFLIGITVEMHIHNAPKPPHETYTQGFWYAVISAVLYMVCSMMLMVNMLGYFLGHYPQHFNLTDSQRTLILQTMLFFIWLAGGGFMFARVENDYGETGWSFVDALYFCDVTILTVGFGDLYPTDDVGRGLVFPYSVVGIIMLGLTISSISSFAAELSKDQFIKKHVEKQRVRTLGRSTTISQDTESSDRGPIDRSSISGPSQLRTANTPLDTLDPEKRAITIQEPQPSPVSEEPFSPKTLKRAATFGLKHAGSMVMRIAPGNRNKMILLREEKDRFEAMRKIQRSTDNFKKYSALAASVVTFGLLWCVGAVVFWQCEKNTQGMTYFQALYFGYVSLLTIGYGDLAPKSNAGRPFFVVWSLLAVPTMTILISHMGDTVISSFNKGTFILADFTVLPQEGAWRNFLERHPWLLLRIKHYLDKRAAKKRLETGFEAGPDPALEEGTDALAIPTIEERAAAAPKDVHDLAKQLSAAIRKVAHDLRHDVERQYTYEEWAEFTELIRFSSPRHRNANGSAEATYDDTPDDMEQGTIEWDWIGSDSPMMTGQTEPEFVLDRLTESMARYIRDQDPHAVRKEQEKREENARISRLSADVQLPPGSAPGWWGRRSSEAPARRRRMSLLSSASRDRSASAVRSDQLSR